VPANAAQSLTSFKADVSAFVDNLDKKHAIFLVAESNEAGPLFDLAGFGFSARKKPLTYPAVPTVSIQVNGKALELPSVPVRSTNANGLVGYDLYEATCTLPENTTTAPTVSATASDKAVRVSVKQVSSTSDKAVVTFDYKGIVKTYYIVFASK
jgi:arabinoxylan arabinofuranohydrolase